MRSLTLSERRRRILLVSCAFARNLAIYRSGQGVGKSLIKNKQTAGFWREINSSCLDIAVLEWCKLFADNGGKHHWKRVIASGNHTNFERGLKRAMGQNARQHAAYLKTMRTYRDKFIAHLDDERVMQIPSMDPAVQAVWYLYGYLAENECQPTDFLDLPNTKAKFESAYQQFMSQVKQVFVDAQQNL